jgi:hypothetical protein
MNSPARAIWWQMWHPHRWFVAAELAYLLLAAVVSHLLPALFRRTTLDATEIPTATLHLCMPVSLIIVHWVAIFQLTSTDFKSLGFPTFMFVLPVRTQTLVAWPMLYGCVALASLWLFIACLILRPVGIAVPLWGPAAALAAGLTMLQALSWTPFTQNWLRIVLAGPLFLAWLSGIGLLLYAEVPQVFITVVLLGVVALCYTVAVRAVARNRRGDNIEWRRASRIIERATVRRLPSRHPFASPAAAQVWFEWRGHGWLLPVFILCILVVTPGVVFVHPDDMAFPWKMLAVVLALPTLIAGIIGGSLGRQDAWSKYEMTSFMATRPVTTAALVRAKLVMAALSTAATWLVVLAFVSLIFLRPGFPAAVLDLAQAAGPGKTLAIALAILAAAVASTWLSLVQNLWLGLTGRSWVVTVVPVIYAVAIFAGVGVGFWIYLHPQWYAAVRAAAPWLVYSLLLVKLIVAAVVVMALARSQLVARSSIGAMLGIWSVVVAGLCLAVYYFVPSEHLPLGMAAAAIALNTPFSRLAGAPLAVAWNRHR